MILYHGTSAPPFKAFKKGMVFLTNSPQEAAAYALNDIIGGGRGKGKRRVLKVDAAEGYELDITPAVDEAIMEEPDFDAWLTDMADEARNEGAHYLIFHHPSAFEDDEIRVTVSLLPDQDLTIRNEMLFEGYKLLHPMLGRVHKAADEAIKFFSNLRDKGLPFTEEDRKKIDLTAKDTRTSSIGGWDDYDTEDLEYNLRKALIEVPPPNWKEMRMIDIARGYRDTPFEELAKFCMDVLKYYPLRVNLNMGAEDYETASAREFMRPEEVDFPEDAEEEYGWTEHVLPFLKFCAVCAQHASAMAELLGDIRERTNRYFQSAGKSTPESGGEHFPEGVQETEIMWHATTAYRAIMKQGFKTRDELEGKTAGLGGGPSNVISFTADKRVAEYIVDDILELMELLESVKNVGDIVSFLKGEGIDYAKVPDYIWKMFNEGLEGKKNKFGYFEYDRWLEGVPKEEDLDMPANVKSIFKWYQYFLSWAQEEGIRYNPVFFGVDERFFLTLAPEDVDVIEATVNTAAKGVSYLSSMEEWRIPKEGILSFGAVGSQKKEEVA